MKQRRRGSVIVVVLVLITLASLLLGRFMEDNSLELSMITHEADKRRLRADAQSELELAIAVIAEIRSIDLNKIHAVSQGFEDPHAYAGFPPREGLEVSFEFEDESSKLSLSTTDKNGLIQLLYSLGQEQRDAERVADAIVAWTSKKYESIEEEATDAAYERSALSHRPARRPIRNFEEFRTIGVAKEFFFDEEGRPTPLFEAFKGCVSLYTFDRCNINTASDAVILSQGLDDKQLAIIRERQATDSKRIVGTPPYFRVTSEVRQMVGGNAPLQRFDDEIQILWVRATVKEGLAQCRTSALVAIRSDITFTAAVADPETSPSIDIKGSTKAPIIPKTSGTSTASAGSTTSTTKAAATSTTTPGVEPPTSLGKSTLGGRASSKTINYPFQILAWNEDNGPAKKPPTPPPTK